MQDHSTTRTLSHLSPRPSPPASQEVLPPAEPYCYIRVSTLLQQMRGFSLPRQFRLCNEVAIADDVGSIPDENLFSDADSGKTFHRVDLQKLLDLASQGRVSVVYFDKVDRIGRHARDSLEIVERLHKCGVKIVIRDPRIDTTTPFGKFLFTMLAAMAEWEAAWILERTRGGKIEKLEQLEASGRPAPLPAHMTPYGLRWVGDHYEKNQDEARVVLLIFEWAASGHGSRTIANMLNERGIPAPRAAMWSDRMVLKIIHTTVYIGVMKIKLEREYSFPCPRFVPNELHRIANEQVKQNKTESKRNAKHDFLLCSTREHPLLKCLICHERGEERIMGGRYRARPGANGGGWRVYRCDHRVKGRRQQHDVGANKIETAVWEALVAALKNHQQVLDNLRKLQDAASGVRQELEQELADLEAKAAENRLAQQRLARLAARGKLDEDIIASQADELEQEASAIAGRIALWRVQIEQAQAEALPIEAIAAACQLVAESADGFTFEEKRWVIRTLVNTVYADTQRWGFEGKLPWSLATGRYERVNATIK